MRCVMNCIIKTYLPYQINVKTVKMTDYHDKQFEFKQEKSLLDIMNYTEFRY